MLPTTGKDENVDAFFTERCGITVTAYYCTISLKEHDGTMAASDCIVVP